MAKKSSFKSAEGFHIIWLPFLREKKFLLASRKLLTNSENLSSKIPVNSDAAF
jgi:hypothetical protein